jgi:hypothetical protein
VEEGGPVLNGAKEVADVHKVKVVILPGPGEACVCDLEVYIWRDPFWLAWGEI